MSRPSEQPANRLINETSPYLLKHAHNPVDWYPWGAEALESARRSDRPILLSVGYSACHWCHVMETESFEDPAIAGLMNQHFVCIKVDREERPDIDEVYMTATIAMSGSGGWPMTVFLTPDLEPFFAGTYFPPADSYGRPGFARVLQRIADMWRSDRKRLRQAARELTELLRNRSTAEMQATVEPKAIAQAVQSLAGNFDPRYGGFSLAPKFPTAAPLSLLLRHHHRTGDRHSLTMVKTTLDGMKNGGIYDQLGGGFARYSTDERWLVPHFEKMLYDNALLARLYLEAFQVTRDEEYRRIASETLDYVLREMKNAQGAFCCSTDADSEGVEGKFYIFSESEIRDVLSEQQADWFCRYYAVSEAGNWQGGNILHTPVALETLAAEMTVPVEQLRTSLNEARRDLYRVRQQRVAPFLDDKVLLSWNALMIGALAEGYRVLDRKRYLEGALGATRFILDNMRRPDGGLYRTARATTVHLDAYLEDYAFLADALIDLYEAGAPSLYLGEALQVAERMISDFSDPSNGGFFQTAHQHEALIVRARDGQDGSLPSANATAARALARLSFHFERSDLREHSARAIRAFGKQIELAPEAFASALAVVDFLARGPVQLALVGTTDDPRYIALLREVAEHYLPNRTVAHLDPATVSRQDRGFEAKLPLLEGKNLLNGSAALYLCRDFTCIAPITEAEEVSRALTRMRADNSSDPSDGGSF
ncbi:MAG: thioredoxin domain-containing protein [Deltaproteobacteria bacterium]|nr:thioredoxin domain-containing protein [Deltaproteobacteria bacterium]